MINIEKMKTGIKLLGEEIELYERMITFVDDNCDYDSSISMRIMLDMLGENWDHMYSPLCLHYESCCYKCPINLKDVRVGYICRRLWCDMNMARDWEEWKAYAEEMKRLLVLRKEELEGRLCNESKNA